MILIDTNLLVYAHDRSFACYSEARTWLDEQFNSPGRVGLPWESLVGFIRLVSNGRIVREPRSVAQAWRQVSLWLTAPGTWCPAPGELHAAIMDRLLSNPILTHRHVHDAHLAALAIEHGLTLCSTDGDFARFEGLRWMNPLSASGKVRERSGRYRARRA